MIDYKRTNWYGWSYLCMYMSPGSGSVIPKSIPPMLIAAVLGAISPRVIIAFDTYGYARELFGETYGMQIFGIVFGYLSVGRLNICYSRYWEGVGHVKMMHSKWSDAAAQAVAFDRVGTHATNLTDDAFCRHLVHLFSQLSAMATMALHVNKAGVQAAEEGINLEWLRSPDTGGRSLSEEEEEMGTPDSSRKSLAQQVVEVGTQAVRGKKLNRMGSTFRPNRRRRAAALNDSFSKEELDFYDQNRGCAVHTTVNRIIRSMTTRQKSGGLNFAPPIISRIYQELSNGLLAYNQAIKLKQVSVPFVYVQYQALLLFLCDFATPFAVGAFTSSWSCAQGNGNPRAGVNTCGAEFGTCAVSAFLSAMIVGSFNAMWLIANELEDPFGMEPNDICMMDFHHEFCGLLTGLLNTPWMDKDDWLLTPDGPWKQPPTEEEESKPKANVGRKSMSSGRPSVMPDATPNPAALEKAVSIISAQTDPASASVAPPPAAASAPAASSAPAEGGAAPAAGNVSKWSAVRAAVVTEKPMDAVKEDAVNVAISAFSSRGKSRRLRGLFGGEAAAEEKYVAKMQKELFVIPA